jgi:hypothetical protein
MRRTDKSANWKPHEILFWKIELSPKGTFCDGGQSAAAHLSSLLISWHAERNPEGDSARTLRDLRRPDERNALFASKEIQGLTATPPIFSDPLIPFLRKKPSRLN